LHAVRDQRPQVVLLDVVLPDLDGFTVAEQLAEKEPGPIVVLTSSREAAEFGGRLARSSADGFIHKDDLSGAALAALAAHRR
jgi:DNA-binding NarL/FixJ family response regulator